MIEFEIVIEINRPIDEVFAFLERAENIPLHNVVCKEAHRESEGPIGVGDMSVAS